MKEIVLLLLMQIIVERVLMEANLVAKQDANLVAKQDAKFVAIRRPRLRRGKSIRRQRR